MANPDRFALIDIDKMVYRGGQPSEEHLHMLKDIGIKHIINLRKEDISERVKEKSLCLKLGINYHAYPTYGIFGLNNQFINEIVDLINSFDGPTYIHCKNGRDRTSIIIASYLVKYKGKDKDNAWKTDVLKYDHDENDKYYAKFKESFYDFCNSLK
ncbi:MAG: hypothetical protein Barrevirus1_65 [Barrevirus sp.]|uniref:Tyrosine-protein phosphatase domain-containing protein n=1 Tax=Barrevirus sp. TaxID=2487763 RepID=A0A3G4ZTA2_9VIRU|nr:MAG: hypothetical protein Barrevirus1_65 [Barrevirus sp.]